MHTNVQEANYSVGKGPVSVAIEDLNKDGYLDIVTANYKSNSVSVLFGNSIGTFSPAPHSPYSVGTHSWSVSIADLNGDSYLDIVIANKGDNSVSVLLGNSAGTFAQAPDSPYSVGVEPRSVAIADLNKDGYLDIVTANYESNSVSILLGCSGVAFSQSKNSPYSVGTNPYSVVIGDLNKDGYLDIVTANYGAHSISALLGNSVGTFSQAPNSPYSVGVQPHSIAIPDLNKDGYLDIVVVNSGSNSISVLLGNSAGTFSQAPNSPYTTGENPVSVAIADLNKDNNLDIVIANHGAHSVSVLLGNSAGTFFLSSNFPYSAATYPTSVKIADLNKDGNLDIVTANWGVDSVSILFGTIDGPFSQSMSKFIAQEIRLAIKEHKRDQVEKNILCPLFIAGSLVIGAKLWPTLFKGATIGVLFGTAACIGHNYDDITDYVAKLIGDSKPEDL
jgi:hypothetical protein